VRQQQPSIRTALAGKDVFIDGVVSFDGSGNAPLADGIRILK
jgi:hypothetical protein